MNKKIISAALATCLIGGAFAFSHLSNPKELPCTKEIPKEFQAEEKILPVASAAEENLFVGMDSAVRNILNDGSEYAVYIAYPQKSQTPYIYNSKKFRSASMIKVFILATAMELVKDGNLSLDQPMTIDAHNKVGGAGILAGYPTGTKLTMREVLRIMIIHSDNTATNMMIDLLGMNTVNEYLQMKGYNDTILQRKMMDFSGRENYTSAKDLGNFFLHLYNLREVNSTYDQLMLEILKDQTDTECLNTACPDKIIAHKTGALSGLFDDGGIIYGGKNGDTVLILMTENFTGEKIVIDRMKKFARHIIY